MIQTFWLKIKDSFFVALTAVLIVLIAILLVWFVIKVIPKAFSLFRSGVATTLDSVFISGDDSTTEVNKKSIASGDIFDLSLGTVNNGELYTFLYPCMDGVSFSLTDSQKTKIECGKDFFLLNKESTVSIVGYSTKARINIVPIKIGLQKQDSQNIENIYNFKLTITNQGYSAPVATTTTTNTPVYTNNTTPTNIYVGKADLSVRIIDTGIINRNTLQFTKTAAVSSTDRAGVKFEVRNIGGRATGAWNFTASMPSQTSPSYQSDSQVSLKPGDRIEFTLGFDNPSNVIGVNNFSVSIDPQNYIDEANELNNTASISIYTNSYNNNNYNNYDYNNYNQNYTGNLTASCYSIPTNPAIGESVTWYAIVNGGSGTYTYYWSGTDTLVGSSQSVSRIYYTGGQKSANVIITSGNNVISKGCTVNIPTYNIGNNTNSDLSVRLIGVGMLDSSNNFVYATQVPRYSNIAIKFEVTNNGTGNSGPWDLSANMSPSMSYYTFKSNNYPSLAPGQKTEVVVNFSSAEYYGNNTIYVKIDPSNLINETNETNNNLSADIRIY
jgi:hypothetical protein